MENPQPSASTEDLLSALQRAEATTGTALVDLLQGVGDELRSEKAREAAPDTTSFLSLVLPLARKHASNDDVCVQLMRTIGNYISEQQERVSAVAQSELAPFIVSCLEANKDSDLRRVAAATIMNMYGVEIEGLFTEDLHTNVIAALIFMLSDEDERLKSVAVNALLNAVESEEAVTLFIAAGGQDPLLDILGHQEEADSVVVQVVSLLTTLCAHLGDPALASDFCEALTSLLVNQQRPPEVCQECVDALSSVYDDKQCRSAFYEAAVLSGLTDVILEGVEGTYGLDDDMAGVVLGCAELLCKVVLNDDGADAAVEAGCLSRLAPLLPSVVDPERASIELLDCFLVFFGNVVRTDAVCVTTMQLMDGLTLARMCKHTSARTQQLALGLVRNLAMVSEHKEVMCLTGVMLAAVECMLSEDENLVLAATSAVKDNSDSCGMCVQFIVDREILLAFAKYLPPSPSESGIRQLPPLSASSTSSERICHALTFEFARCLSELIRRAAEEDVLPLVQRDSLLVLSFLYTLVASEHEVMQREGLESLARVLQLPGSVEVASGVRELKGWTPGCDRISALCKELYIPDDITYVVIMRAMTEPTA